MKAAWAVLSVVCALSAQTKPGVDSTSAEWPMAPGSYSNTRYSTLNQVNRSNVGSLKLAWSFETGLTRGHEAAPLVVGDTMYIVTPFPNRVYAFDLNKNGGRKWEYHPTPAPAAQGVACCDTVNRGAAYSNGKIIFNTFDVHTIALDAATGKLLWKTKLGDYNLGESITMAPLVVKGKVLVGNSGGEFGVRGWVTALDENTGAIVWRAYSTGPDKDVLIGANFKPFYEDHKGGDLGLKSWMGDQWRIGGGTVWGFLSYDPEADLIYYGTGNPGPWNSEQRPGDNKWTSTIFARRPETGEAVWAYQVGPHDEWDYDSVNECILADITFQGKPRKVLLHPGRNGFVLTLDRLTGQVLAAGAFTHVNTVKGLDYKTGRPVENEVKKTAMGKTIKDICPAAPGGKDWQPGSYSPRTGLLYLPHNNLCMEWAGVKANYIAGTPYVGAEVKYYAGPGGHRGEFTAWDVANNKAAWKFPERFPIWSGTVVTAGDVVFFGTMDRWFRAVDARTGKTLWQFQTLSGIIGQPTTFLGPDGKQYVAVMCGVGGWAGAVVSAGLDTRDGTAGNGFGALMADLHKYTPRGGVLYVFSLP
ncbi:MAG: methanol/ethanol family PQQ-dependent dehydrogenase [Bryobacterales bacterium]|nr:methanol/ethanol family PQQ-dependent dehydrogenase [Bryobacterales bacterium]